ncbi:uncharacterized protein TRAVEDRAFT_159017 [Trametes versicolor FP-101664 SS1]|uniref:uncharacterized protein n=1 Tax=Trametes versicolor (strain FP-101664) TaxID=717944 RepID=UPI0004624642|nr:uncharacterized protein TRAVEDRAFT_159017 [Trametes versicolor FP-101664 SS1]EIW64580.1 hypothetical protein TRAVEDRAFT_159017 [Trametes versicolor FP-101664 SS1]
MADALATKTPPAKPEQAAYDPKPSLQYASAVGIQAAGVGALVSAVQNALGTHTSGAAGFLTRTGGTIGFFAAMGATFALTESVVANQRQTDDALNGAAGGCAAGFLAGIRARSLPMAVASCAVLGTAIGTLDYNGKNLVPTDSESIEERRKRFFKQPRPTSSLEPVPDAE